VAEAQRKAMSRMKVPSAQDWETVKQAKAMIDDFEEEVEGFRLNGWRPFAIELEKVGLFPGLE
ncbi:MAG: hypothetical protein AB8H12_24005, partial [Lewinella sp.]